MTVLLASMRRAKEARLKFVEEYAAHKNASYVCRRYGISRPTLRKWVRRYGEHGPQGLCDLSRRPRSSPNRKVGRREEKWILSLRRKRKLGVRRIQNELRRLHACQLSTATIHKVLTRHAVKPLVKLRRKKVYKRYQRGIPGERVQMDTCKIASGIYQYTAVDDCTRYRVLAIYSRRTGANSVRFLEKVIEEMPFPIQEIQTDRGNEFFAEKVQRRMMKFQIRFRPTKPRSPHLNGKVERSQRTDLMEFYSSVALRSKKLADELQIWQHYYNWERPHSSLSGRTPMEKYFEVSNLAPFWEDVERNYDPEKERLQEQDYRVDLQLRRLKGCL